MNKNRKGISALNITIILVSLVITICGVCSFQRGYSYDVVNQYGENVRMWGAGIYAHDSYFKAPIFIGSDFTILIVVIPFTIITFLRMRANPRLEYCIQNFAVISLLLYYSASIALGVTYNRLHLLYIILLGACFYCVGLLFVKLYAAQCYRKNVCQYHISKGIKAYLIIAGISLFVAWLPDIIASFVNGTSLDLIEVYTTEVTYALDMGIVSPLMFLTLYLINRESFIGYVLLRMLLKVCTGVGIMLPVQTAFQMMAGITVPIPALVTKVLIFVMLAMFAAFFECRLKQKTKYIDV